MKVNTDGVLLGAWMTILPSDCLLMDIGTGTGVIALIAAQRRFALSSDPFRVMAIEADTASFGESESNFISSPWKPFLEAKNCLFQGFCSSFRSAYPQQKYDLLFCNPPYFVDSLKAPSQRRNAARHEDSLPQEDIIAGAKELLCAQGRLAMILPLAEGKGFLSLAESNGLYINRLCEVRGKENAPIKRLLMEFSLNKKTCVNEMLTIQKESDYTAEYKSLTKELYLKF